MTVLRTARLRFVPLAASDVEELYELFALAEVRRYLLDDTVMPKSWVEAVVADSEAQFKAAGAGLWTLRDEGDELLGVAGYRDFFEPPQLQVIYALHPRAWGRGLATEALRALLEVGFETCGFEVVRGATDEPNDASIRVMERCGMRRVDPATFEPPLDDAEGAVFLEISRAAWTADGGRVLES
ncbi:MAG: GNAT family N-acetyltransferase [Acidobacteriota bacterium]